MSDVMNRSGAVRPVSVRSADGNVTLPVPRQVRAGRSGRFSNQGSTNVSLMEYV